MSEAYDFDEQYVRWAAGEPWVAGSWSSSNVPAFIARQSTERMRDALQCSCQAEAEARGFV